MNHYSAAIYALWSLGMLLQLLACWTAVARGYFDRWKAFGIYLFCMTASSVAGIYSALFSSQAIYQRVYIISSVLEAVTLSLVVFEIMVKMLEPFDALPGKLLARFGFWAAIGISAAITLSVWIGTAGFILPSGPELTIERTVFLADATLLWLLILQARSLGVSWQSAAAEIAIAFVLYLTVQAAVRFVVVIYANTYLVVDIANRVGQFAYMISLCSWIWTMRKRDPSPIELAPEKLAEIHALASQHGAVPKERIFAAVGIKINKIETSDDPGETEQPDKILLN